MSETATPISVDSVTEAIDGETFIVEAFGSNVKVNFKSLGQLSHLEVCKHLIMLSENLTAAGLPADVRLSWQNREKQWVPYPHCWVNMPRPEVQAAAENTARLSRLENNMSSLMEMVQKTITTEETTDQVIDAEENPL